LAGLVIYIGVLVRAMGEAGLLERFDRHEFQLPVREIFTFTIPVLSSEVVYAVMRASDAVLLGRYGGAGDVGAFRVIQPVAFLNQLVLSSFAFLFTPLAARYFARDDRKAVKDLYWQTASWVALLSFPIFAVSFSLAHPVTVTLFGERYASSATYLMLLSAATYFNAALGFNGLTLKVFGRLRFIVIINILAAAVNVALNLLLIPRYGPLGAAIGTSSTLFAFNLLKQAGLRLSTGISLFERSYLPVYGSVVGATAGLLAVHLVLSPPLPEGLALVLVAALVVFVLGRSALDVAESFPELLRLPLIRLLLVRRSPVVGRRS
jgi:O-antigen/teichoic acid export membrane protein